jgi:outer membrane protein OmpA-like peptidoglycan-associated protein
MIVPVGVGMVAPVAPNTDESGRAKNRRVEVVAM